VLVLAAVVGTSKSTKEESTWQERNIHTVVETGWSSIGGQLMFG